MTQRGLQAYRSKVEREVCPWQQLRELERNASTRGREKTRGWHSRWPKQEGRACLWQQLREGGMTQRGSQACRSKVEREDCLWQQVRELERDARVRGWELQACGRGKLACGSNCGRAGRRREGFKHVKARSREKFTCGSSCEFWKGTQARYGGRKQGDSIRGGLRRREELVLGSCKGGDTHPP